MSKPSSTIDEQRQAYGPDRDDAVGGADQTVTSASPKARAYSINATVPGATVTGGPDRGSRDCQEPAFGAEVECARSEAGLPVSP